MRKRRVMGRPPLDASVRKVKIQAWVLPAVRDRIEAESGKDQPGVFLAKFLAARFAPVKA